MLRLVVAAFVAVFGIALWAGAQEPRVALANSRLEIHCPASNDVVYEVHTEDRDFIARAGGGWITYPPPNHPNHSLWPSEFSPGRWTINVPEGPSGPQPVVASAQELEMMSVHPEQGLVTCTYGETFGLILEASLQNCVAEGSFRTYDQGSRLMCSRGFNEVSDVGEQCHAVCDRPVIARIIRQ